MKNTKRIIVDPHIRFGKPVIQGTRVAVADILDLVRSGYAIAEIPQQYPNITEDDVKAALDYSVNILEDPASVLNTLLSQYSPRVSYV